MRRMDGLRLYTNVGFLINWSRGKSQLKIIRKLLRRLQIFRHEYSIKISSIFTFTHCRTVIDIPPLCQDTNTHAFERGPEKVDLDHTSLSEASTVLPIKLIIDWQCVAIALIEFDTAPEGIRLRLLLFLLFPQELPSWLNRAIDTRDHGLAQPVNSLDRTNTNWSSSFFQVVFVCVCVEDVGVGMLSLKGTAPSNPMSYRNR